MHHDFPARVLGLCALIAVATILRPMPAAADGNGSPVCTAAGDQVLPVAVTDMAGGVIIAWHDNRPSVAPGGVCFAQRLDASGAAQWAANGVQLSTTGDPGAGTGNTPGRVGITSDGAGGAYVVYGGNTASPHVQWVNAAGAPQWGADGVALTTLTGGARDVAITRDLGGLGGVITAWREDNATGGTSDFSLQTVGASGALGPGREVMTSTIDEALPALLSDGVGGVFVVWDATANGLKMQRFNSNFSGVWSQIPLSTMANNEPPVVTSDGAGGVIVAWSGGGSWTQRVDPNGNRMWSPRSTGISLSTSGRSVALLGDGAGGAILTWQDSRSTTNFNLYAQRVNSLGAQLWAANGAEICYFTQDQVSPQIVSDGGTGAIIAWSDSRQQNQSGADIYGERIDANATRQWLNFGSDPNGIPLCTALGDQVSPTMVADGAGGAWIAWQDHRGADDDIYAQRVNPSGLVLAAPAVSIPASAPRAWPNPFADRVQLAFELLAAAKIHMDVADVAGRTVRELGAVSLGAGRHALAWDGRTEDGRRAGAGIYFLRVSGAGVALTQRVVRIR